MSATMFARPLLPNSSDEPSARIEAVYRRIDAERMADFPLRNPALQVEAIGFRLWQTADEVTPSTPAALLWAGIMLTPWFMNFVLLPADAQDLPAVPPGGEVWMRFPGGSLPLLAGHDADLGPFRLCSLFSPVLQFTHQTLARQTACAMLDKIFCVSPQVGINLKRRRLFGLG